MSLIAKCPACGVIDTHAYKCPLDPSQQPICVCSNDGDEHEPACPVGKAPKQEPPKTPAQARDDFLEHLRATLTPEQQAITFRAADKLLELVVKPNMLNAFVLVNAELAALHAEGNLSAPEIARIGFPGQSYGGTD